MCQLHVHIQWYTWIMIQCCQFIMQSLNRSVLLRKHLVTVERKNLLWTGKTSRISARSQCSKCLRRLRSLSFIAREVLSLVEAKVSMVLTVFVFYDHVNNRWKVWYFCYGHSQSLSDYFDTAEQNESVTLIYFRPLVRFLALLPAERKWVCSLWLFQRWKKVEYGGTSRPLGVKTILKSWML